MSLSIQPWSRLRRWCVHPKRRAFAFFVVSASIGAFVATYPVLAALAAAGYVVGRLARFSDSWVVVSSRSVEAANADSENLPEPTDPPLLEDLGDDDEDYLVLIDDDDLFGASDSTLSAPTLSTNPTRSADSTRRAGLPAYGA